MGDTRLRDRLEEALWSWHCHEIGNGRPSIIDYNVRPGNSSEQPRTDRIATYELLRQLRDEALTENADAIASRADAEITYLRALLGERFGIESYIRDTQACAAYGWSNEHVHDAQEVAAARLDAAGIPWNADTRNALERSEGLVDEARLADLIRAEASRFEPIVRKLTGSDAEYTLDIRTVSEDAYWSYWLDTVGSTARLRINTRKARFTEVAARQFALHEVLGHALQSASYAAEATHNDVPWLRFFTLHGPHQVMFEGLAQALPLFAAADDDALLTRVALDHYCQLVMGELHLAINSGVSAAVCIAHARARVPFWTDEQISDLLSERSINPQLRSYLWSYPAGMDWFVTLARADEHVKRKVLHAAYQAPLTPADLHNQWPAGPPIGGRAEAVRLREPTVSGGPGNPH